VKKLLAILAVLVALWLIGTTIAWAVHNHAQAKSDQMGTCMQYVTQHGPASIGTPGYNQACP
jgi:hypothetical protein